MERGRGFDAGVHCGEVQLPPTFTRALHEYTYCSCSTASPSGSEPHRQHNGPLGFVWLKIGAVLVHTVSRAKGAVDQGLVDSSLLRPLGFGVVFVVLVPSRQDHAFFFFVVLLLFTFSSARPLKR